MEHRPVRETFAQATTTAAAAIHRCVAPCERLFHASCTCAKSPIANDGVTLPENRPVTPEELVLPSSNSHVEPNGSRLLSAATPHDDSLIEDPLIGYVENVEDVMSDLLERISILPFLLKNKKTFIKIAMIF